MIIINGRNFIKPIVDLTKQVHFVHYINRGLLYGYNTDKSVFYLCEGNTLETTVKKILFEHNSFEEVQKEYYKQRENY